MGKAAHRFQRKAAIQECGVLAGRPAPASSGEMLRPDVPLRSKAGSSPKEKLFLEAVAGPVTPADPLTPAGRGNTGRGLGMGDGVP